MTPPGLDPRRTLVIIDLSWWLAKAFHARGVEGIAPVVIGWLVALLSDPAPAAVAVALDSVGPTWRHRLTAELAPEQRYKAGREPRPPEYRSVCNRVIDIIDLHRIPLLAAEGWEADDAIAATVPRAHQLGYQVAVLTADKDLHQLVDASTAIWDGAADVRGVGEVVKKWGIAPRQMGDFLAIMGDAGDNVPGCKGLGDTKAAAILQAFGTLDRALGVVPEAPTPEAMKAAEKARDKAKKLGGDALAYAEQDLAGLRKAKSMAGWLTTLQAARAEVERSRVLVTLDAAAPIVWQPEELPVGGYEVEELRKAYEALGFTALAREVGPRPKVAFASGGGKAA